MRPSAQHPDPFDPLQENAEPFDWRYYLHVVLERWWLVCLALLLGAILSVFLISREKTLYGARAVLFIEQQREQVLNDRMQSVRDDEIRSIDMINTVVETLNSYPMAERVARRLELASDPAFVKAIDWDTAADGELTPGAAAGALPDLVQSSYREMTRLIDVIARTTDPQISTKLANGYADEYLRMLLEQTTEATKAASQFLVEEAARLGFDGGEAWYDYEMQPHWRPSPLICETIDRQLRELGLLRTCGTDSHGIDLGGR